MSRISTLNRPCTIITELGPRGRHLLWNRVLPTRCFIVNCRRPEQKQIKHVWWLSSPVDYIVLNGKIADEWWILKDLERRTNPKFLSEDWGKPRKVCQNSQCQGRDSNQTRPEYNSRALPLHQPVIFLVRNIKEMWTLTGMYVCPSALSSTESHQPFTSKYVTDMVTLVMKHKKYNRSISVSPFSFS
jgi:hypothetical protein